MATDPQTTITGHLSKVIPETLKDIKTGFQTIYGRLRNKDVSLLKAYPIQFSSPKKEPQAQSLTLMQKIQERFQEEAFSKERPFNSRLSLRTMESPFHQPKNSFAETIDLLQEDISEEQMMSSSHKSMQMSPLQNTQSFIEEHEDSDTFQLSATQRNLCHSQNDLSKFELFSPTQTMTYKVDKDSNERPTQAKTERISFDRLKIAFQDLNKISWDGLSKITTLFFICISPVYSKFTFFMGFVAGTILAIHNHCEEKGMAELVYQGKDLKSRSIRHLILSTFAHVSSKIFSTAGKVFPILRSGFVLSTALSGFTLGYELSDFLLERFDLNPETNPTWEVREQQHLRNESAKKIQKGWKACKLRDFISKKIDEKKA